MPEHIDPRVENIRAHMERMKAEARLCDVEAPYGLDLRDIFQNAARELDLLAERIEYEDPRDS